MGVVTMSAPQVPHLIHRGQPGNMDVMDYDDDQITCKPYL